MTFGEKLAKLRKGKGLSQEELASQISVSRQSVSRWESGDTMPDAGKLLLLSRLLGVSADYLLHDELGEPNPGPAPNPAKPRVAELMLLLLGAAGHLAIWIASTMVPVHVTKTMQNPDGTVRYYGGGDVWGYDYVTFVSEYRLWAVWWVLLLLLAAGGTMLLWQRKTN